MNDPRTWTTGWRWTVGMGAARWRRATGENWNNCNRINKDKKEKRSLKKKQNKMCYANDSTETYNQIRVVSCSDIICLGGKNKQFKKT